jgi:ubiquinone/menaquinone biosynthesis C-methylase UbiE
VPFEETRATSFGRVAESYDQVRPGPAAAAVDWLLPTGCVVAVDLAAGTGLFTRAIQERVQDVVAVEPDGRMREILAARSPDVRVLDGQAEAIPLPDGYADAVFVSTAWHWFDPVRAVSEVTRVLKDGGRLGVLWTSRDREEAWVADLDLLRDDRPSEPRTVAAVREQLARHHSVTLPEGAELGPAQMASFGFSRTLTLSDTLDWLATSSRFITAADADREAALDRLRRALMAHSEDGNELIRMPLRSWCWRADRLPRKAR